MVQKFKWRAIVEFLSFRKISKRIAIVLCLMHTLPALAQQRTDLYYMKNEIVPSWNKLTYMVASEIETAQPKQLIVQHREPIAILSLNDSVPFLTDPSNPPAARPSHGLLTIYAPYRLSAAKITDQSLGKIVFEQKNINSQIFTADFSKLKNNFYILEIISADQEE